MLKKREKIMLVGSGGREHAMYPALSRNGKREVIVAPGNAGIPEKDRRPVESTDLLGLLRLARKEKVKFTVVGPDRPVVQGIADLFTRQGLSIFSPSQGAAQLEGSKARCKLICWRYGIPTADYGTARDMMRAEELIHRLYPVVIKADGLRDGKGVKMPDSIEEAIADAREELGDTLSVEPIVIECKLYGYELSVTALCDGKRSMLLELVRDYKTLPGSKLMTGGMGAFSPVVRGVSRKLLREIKRTIIDRLLYAMRQEGTPYHGVLYAGIMVTNEGPKLLEVNARFGDPEAQVLLPRLKSDLLPYLCACTEFGGLSKMKPLRWKKSAAVCFVIASRGYPEHSEEISGFHGTEFALQIPGTRLYRAGNKGRVLNVVNIAPTLTLARERGNIAAHLVSIVGGGEQVHDGIAAGV